MNIVVMSDKYPCFCNELQSREYEVVPTDTINKFLIPEQKHADMQVLNIDNNIFMLDECAKLKDNLSCYNPIISTKKANGKYPDNIQLNFLYLNNTIYGKLSAMSPQLADYCKGKNIKMINVNQGYCRCSTLIIDKNSVITSDDSIEKALKNNGVEVLKISSGNIVLEGFDYGFIGGASAKINNTLFFFGNIPKHTDYKFIKDFITKRNIKIEILCKEMPLTDIGGAVEI